MPSLRDAAEVQEQLWLGEGFAALADAADARGDVPARSPSSRVPSKAQAFPGDVVARALVRRATVTRAWTQMMHRYDVLLLPVSAELPFPDGLDLEGEASFRRVWEAQLPQRGLPAVGLPCLTVATGLAGTAPVGVQIVAARYREDLCLRAGAAIEAGGVPPAPIDPAN